MTHNKTMPEELKDELCKEELVELAMEALTNSIWRPASVTDEPETRLGSWQVYEVAADFNNRAPTIHLVGWTGYEGRVCSAVQEFDKTTMKCRTRSGRVYELVGPPGFNRDAEHTFGMWLQRTGNPEIRCITEDYYHE